MEQNDELQTQNRYMQIEGFAEPADKIADLKPLQIAPKAARAMTTSAPPRNYTSLTDVTRVAACGLERAFLDQRGDAPRREAALRIATLSRRQRDVMERVAHGAASNVVAFELGITQRTVENHRAAVMGKLSVRSAAAPARLVCRAADSRFLSPRA